MGTKATDVGALSPLPGPGEPGEAVAHHWPFLVGQPGPRWGQGVGVPSLKEHRVHLGRESR